MPVKFSVWSVCSKSKIGEIKVKVTSLYLQGSGQETKSIFFRSNYLARVSRDKITGQNHGTVLSRDSFITGQFITREIVP